MPGIRRLLALLLLATLAIATEALARPSHHHHRRTVHHRRSSKLGVENGRVTCPVLPADNAFNQDVSRLPVDPRSDAYVASIGAAEHLHADFGSNPSYGIPYTVVGAHQPRVPITFTAYGDQSDPGPYPVPANAPVEGGSDHHVLVVQNGTCRLYELYAAQRAGLGWNAGSGAVFDLRSDRLRPDTQTSADAAGLPISPGSSATTRRAPATSTTPCASRSPARRRRSCIRPRTSPRTPPTPAGRPWGCGCG